MDSGLGDGITGRAGPAWAQIPAQALKSELFTVSEPWLKEKERGEGVRKKEKKNAPSPHVRSF